MKILNKIYALASLLFVMSLASCDTNQEEAVYNGGQNVSFGASTITLTNSTLDYDSPEFTVTLYRSQTTGELTGKVTAQEVDNKNNPTGVTFPVTDYTFKDGEGKTTVTVDVSSLKGGDGSKIMLSLPEDVASDLNYANATVSVSRDYKWIQLEQKGTFADNYFAAGKTYTVEVIQASTNGTTPDYPIYRIMNPYKEMIANKDYTDKNLVESGSPSDYIEIQPINVLEDGSYLMYFSPISTGLGLAANDPITAYHPMDAGYASKYYYNDVMTGKTIRLAPTYYAEASGSEDDHTGDAKGTIIITLP